MNIKVPFNDLNRQYMNIKEEIDFAISSVISKSAFIRGEYVEKFENEFAKLMGADHCISCANGTDSLYIAMKALGIKNGDEVIVPANSWISTSETVTQAGGRVVFCDIDDKSYTIDINDLNKKITANTVGIIPVHLFGHPAEMDEIMKISKDNKLWVLEDCAQAHLAEYNGRKVGTFGDAASFSFYPGKNLGAMGDAGAILTSNSELAKKMAMFARHGGLKKGEHNIEGINSRLDGIQAAILSVKLCYIEEWTKKRQNLASIFLEEITGNNLISNPIVANDVSHAWHLYVIETEKRDSLIDYLTSKGIQTVINYPLALPFLQAYKYLSHSHEDFKKAYSKQSRILSIPIFPEMSKEEQDYLIQSINNFT